MLSKIFVATDFSETGNSAIPYAYAIAEAGGTVYLVHVIEHEEQPNPLYAHYALEELDDPEKKAATLAKVKAELTRLIPAMAKDKNITTVATVAIHQNIPDGIVQEAHACGAQAVVVGSHGRGGLRHLLLGSVAESVMRNSHKPTLVIPYFEDRGTLGDRRHGDRRN